jgi:peptidoglycan/xylan/chitin deacetylase (PgdA/CDA1 family)
MMTPRQVRELADAGMTIGSHAEWHISLVAEGPDEYARQLRNSRQTLRDMCEQPVDYFSYPFGDPDYCIPAWPLVRDAGYTAAFMACGLPADLRHGPWLIDRHASGHNLFGLYASILGVKPSQFRNRRRLARCFEDGPAIVGGRE